MFDSRTHAHVVRISLVAIAALTSLTACSKSETPAADTTTVAAPAPDTAKAMAAPASACAVRPSRWN